MQRLGLRLDFDGRTRRLSSSERVAWPVFLDGCPGPHRSGMTPVNVNPAKDEDTPASRYCVIAPAVSGEGNGPFRVTSYASVKCAEIHWQRDGSRSVLRHGVLVHGRHLKHKAPLADDRQYLKSLSRTAEGSGV